MCLCRHSPQRLRLRPPPDPVPHHCLAGLLLAAQVRCAASLCAPSLLCYARLAHLGPLSENNISQPLTGRIPVRIGVSMGRDNPLLCCGSSTARCRESACWSARANPTRCCAGNPVGLANPTLRRGASTIPGYAVQQPPRNPASTSQQASSASRSTEISSSDSFAGKPYNYAAAFSLLCIRLYLHLSCPCRLLLAGHVPSDVIV